MIMSHGKDSDLESIKTYSKYKPPLRGFFCAFLCSPKYPPKTQEPLLFAVFRVRHKSNHLIIIHVTTHQNYFLFFWAVVPTFPLSLYNLNKISRRLYSKNPRSPK